MPTPTYTPLANITLSTTATSVTFSSISAGYRDIVAVVTAKSTSGTPALTARVNGATSGYSWVRIGGNGSSFLGGATTGGFPDMYFDYYADLSSTDYGTHIINFMDYSATDKQKMMFIRADRDAAGTELFTYKWGSTAAINSIRFADEGSAGFAAGSTFAIYGIAA